MTNTRTQYENDQRTIRRLAEAQRVEADAAEALREQLADLTRQRDDLLAALKTLVTCPTVSGIGPHIRDEARHAGRKDELAQAREAIARVEGGGS